MSATTRTASRRSGGGTGSALRWGSVLLILAASVLAIPTTIVTAIGMLPTMAALMMEESNQRNCALTVGPLNFCGVLPQLLDLWNGGHSLDAALAIVMNPFNWALMFGAAAGGWFVFYAVPPLVAGVVQLRAEARLNAVTRDQKKLIDDWGDAVGGDARGRSAAESLE